MKGNQNKRSAISKIYSLFTFLFFIVLFTNCDSSSPILSPPVEEEMPELEPEDITPSTEQATIAFYNVENLFDTENDPDNPRDNEFLPNSEKQWTPERYAKKLDNISKVMQGLNFPIIMGLAEVENRKVIEDLINTELLSGEPYQIVHQDAPDHRGIDVALIYQAEQFTLTDWEAYRVTIEDPNIADFTTRDILRVSGELFSHPVHIFVNHWPSRSGGTSQTEFRRVAVANQLNDFIKETQAKLPEASLLLMGDFNDEPTNKSIAEILGVQPLEEERNPAQLYNCTTLSDNLGEGSYNYQGNWQMLDQIMATGSLLNSQAELSLQNFQVYREPSLFFTHPEYGLSPDRTYGGDEYYGGFSDHLPVYMEVIRE